MSTATRLISALCQATAWSAALTVLMPFWTAFVCFHGSGVFATMLLSYLFCLIAGKTLKARLNQVKLVARDQNMKIQLQACEVRRLAKRAQHSTEEAKQQAQDAEQEAQRARQEVQVAQQEAQRAKQEVQHAQQEAQCAQQEAHSAQQAQRAAVLREHEAHAEGMHVDHSFW